MCIHIHIFICIYIHTCEKKMMIPVKRLAKNIKRSSSMEPHAGTRNRPMTKKAIAMTSASTMLLLKKPAVKTFQMYEWAPYVFVALIASTDSSPGMSCPMAYSSIVTPARPLATPVCMYVCTFVCMLGARAHCKAHILHHPANAAINIPECVAVCGGVLQCVAVCSSVLRCVAVCCSVLRCVAGC